MLSNLQKSYPREKMEEISTSFCFICLLHLANEQGLKIRNEDTEDDVEEESESIGENRIGNIWDLKVCTLLYQVHNSSDETLCRSTGIPMLHSLHDYYERFNLSYSFSYHFCNLSVLSTYTLFASCRLWNSMNSLLVL